jgi:microcystin-dependent protein
MDAFYGEIRIFAGNYPPENWAFCDGAQLSILQYQALYSVIGTQFGGDGKTTFALPNLQGCVALGQGTGLGLTPRDVGDGGGAAAVTLTVAETPPHNHPLACGAASDQVTPATNSVWAAAPRGRGSPYATPANATTQATNVNTVLNPAALTSVGTSGPHDNLQPYLAMNFIICLDGAAYPIKP